MSRTYVRSGFPSKNPFIAKVIFCLALGVVLCGCASVKYAPPSDAVRQKLEHVAIATNPAAELANPQAPVGGIAKGAAIGFGEGFLGSIGGGAASGNPLGFAAGIVLAPVVGVAGSVVGGVRAHSEVEIKSTDTELRAFLDATPPDKELQQRLLLAAARQAPQSKFGPYEPDNSMKGDSPSDVAATIPRDRRLENSGYDSLLETSPTYAFRVSGRIDPDVTLSATVDVKVFLVGSNTAVYVRRWVYIGATRNYFALGLDHAKLFRQEFERANALLAEKIARDLFVTTQPEEKSDPEPGEVRTVFVGPLP